MCLDGFRLRGRKRSEDRLPNLLKDITAIVDGRAKPIHSFAQSFIYTSDSSRSACHLIAKGYTDEELPTAETIATKLNLLGYYPKKVAKSRPKKLRRPMPSLPR